MHPLFQTAAGMTHDIIGAAIEVHKDKGPGLLESVYEWCFSKELELRGYDVRTQDSVLLTSKIVNFLTMLSDQRCGSTHWLAALPPCDHSLQRLRA